MSAPMRTGLALVLLALGAGCSARPSVTGTRHELALGEHRVSIGVPDGWRLLSFGREVRVSRGSVVLTFGDLGPAGPEGIQREVERARELWRKGQPRDAQWVMKTVPVPDELFGTQVQRTAFWAAWSEVSQAPEDTPAEAIDESFERIRENVAALARPDLNVLAGTVLERIEPKARREVAVSHERLVSGREAVVYRTWDRLTHGHPRKLAIVFDGGYALELDTESGSMFAAAPVFESLLDSLRFVAAASPAAISAGPAPAAPPAAISAPR